MKRKKVIFFTVLTAILTVCSNPTRMKPLEAQAAISPASELTSDEIQGIQILVSARIKSSLGSMEEYLVDQNMLESDDAEMEFREQTQFILSVYSTAYADEAKKRLSKVAEKIDDDGMLLTQKQLYTLLEMAGAKPSKDLASYDYLKQWYQDGYYEIPIDNGVAEVYGEVDFGKIEKREDGKVLVKAILQLQPDYGAVETFKIILEPNPNSIFQYSVENVRGELVQPPGAGVIGRDDLLQKPYVSPLKLTKDPFDYIFELDGDLYRLPCPAGELERHGWEIEEDGTLEAGGRIKVHAAKGNAALTLGLWNYNTAESPLKDCQVVWLKTGRDKMWSNVSFKLEEGVESQMKKSDVEPLYHDSRRANTLYGREDVLYKIVYGYSLHFDGDVIDGFEMGYAPTPVERQKRIRLMTGSWDQDPQTTPAPNKDFDMELDHVYLVDIDGDGTKEEICVKVLGGVEWADSTCLFMNGKINYVLSGALVDCNSMKMTVENGQYFFTLAGADTLNGFTRKVRVEKGWSEEVASDVNF